MSQESPTQDEQATATSEPASVTIEPVASGSSTSAQDFDAEIPSSQPSASEFSSPPASQHAYKDYIRGTSNMPDFGDKDDITGFLTGV